MVSNFSVITYLRCFSFSASLCSPEGDSRKQLPWFTLAVSPSVDVSSPAHTIFPQRTQHNTTQRDIKHNTSQQQRNATHRKPRIQCEVNRPKTMTKTRDARKQQNSKRTAQDTKHGHIGNTRRQDKTARRLGVVYLQKRKSKNRKGTRRRNVTMLFTSLIIPLDKARVRSLVVMLFVKRMWFRSSCSCINLSKLHLR
jgi:hypothetical protein